MRKEEYQKRNHLKTFVEWQFDYVPNSKEYLDWLVELAKVKPVKPVLIPKNESKSLHGFYFESLRNEFIVK